MKSTLFPYSDVHPKCRSSEEVQRGWEFRVIHVISALQLGGAERVAIDLALEHAKSGVVPCIVSVRRPRYENDPVGRHYREELADHRIPLYELGEEGIRRGMISLPLKLARLVKCWSPHLVHSHTDVPDFVVSSARRLKQFPIARTIHSTSLWHTHKIAGFIAESGFKNDLVIGVSDAALQSYRDLRSRYGLRASVAQRVIVNGVRIIPEDVIGMRKGHSKFGAPLRIAFFGRSSPAKGLDVLVDAFKLIEHQVTDIELTIYSDAALDPLKRSQLSSLPCGVDINPPIPNAAAAMARFDLIVVPSRVEGLGLVVLEALAAGTPVLASRIQGLCEVLPSGWPLLVPPDDPSALAAMLMDIRSGHYDLSALGSIGYSYVKRYSIDTFAQKYLDSYRKYVSAI